MRKALLFKGDVETEVTATDVLDGKYSRNENFVDPEYRFRVVFVKDSKGHTGPYFRLYFSLDYYRAMTPERKTQYDILRGQKHYLESKWHRDWEERLSAFCKIEYFLKNDHGQRRRADAFFEEGKTAIEVQHSFIAKDFELRNAFYSGLGYNIVWLYDLTMMNAVEREGGVIEILENNAKGFFRIAELPENLEEYPVFIQVRGGTIYRVSKLGRKEIEDTRASTVRFFVPDAIFDENSFINGIKSMDGVFLSKPYAQAIVPEGASLLDLWDESYQRMYVENLETRKQIAVFRDYDGSMMREIDNPFVIRFSYVTFFEKTGKVFYHKPGKIYSMGPKHYGAKKWRFLGAEPMKKGTEKAE